MKVDFASLEGAFDQDTIKILSSALADAWEEVQKSGSRLAKRGYANAVREVIAKRIFEMAQSGERDPHNLARDAIRFLSAN